MQFRTLGHSGLKLSVIGLGSWLTYGNTVGGDIARKCVMRAWEKGVNFIDTANVYARGAAESTLGPILKDLNRDELVLATKAYFPMADGVNERGLSRKHLRSQIEASLRRLDVDYVDLYQCHRYDDTTPLEETCRMMDDLVRSGKILYWGVSEWNADQIVSAVNLTRARGWAVPISNQPQYSALWRRIEERVLPACEEYGLGNVVWSPLAMGILSGKYTDAAHPPGGFARCRRLPRDDGRLSHAARARCGSKTRAARERSRLQHDAARAGMVLTSAGRHQHHRRRHQDRTRRRQRRRRRSEPGSEDLRTHERHPQTSVCRTNRI